jgi:hypothetical protein
MTRSEFAEFVERTLEEVLQFAEERTHTSLPRKIKFRWLGQDTLMEKGIVEAIVSRVWVDPGNIYPSVDIGVGDLAEDGAPIVVANVAGYSPRPFQNNWTGRNGPFVFIIGEAFVNKFSRGNSGT